jgi:hypothetical protein
MEGDSGSETRLVVCPPTKFRRITNFIIGGLEFVEEVSRMDYMRLIQSTAFAENIIRPLATRLACKMGDALKPLVMRQRPKPLMYFPNNAGYPAECWEAWETNLQDIFEQCLTLKAKMLCKTGCFRCVWPQPTLRTQPTEDRTYFSPEPDPRRSTSGLDTVLMTMHPAIEITRTESLKEGNVFRPRKVTKVVGKAIVVPLW